MSDQPVQSEAVSASVIVDGGKYVPITIKGQGPANAFVPLIPLRRAQKYLEIQHDINALLEEFIESPIPEKKTGWTDSLTDDSVFELDAALRAINDPRIDRWASRQTVVVETMKARLEKKSQ